MDSKILIFLVFFNLMSIISCQWPKFLFYSRNNQKNYVILTSDNITNTEFNYSKETKFLVHGFASQGEKSSMSKVKNELLINQDLNVIIVDWEKGASAPDYFRAAFNTKIVGRKIAELIVNASINPKTVHCIGHSLGAHVCGYAGKTIKLNRISGLDPAGPTFRGRPASERLDKTDAEYVDNIHTDWLYGIQDPIGHKDFYPNGGSTQTGCSILDTIFGKTENNPELDPSYTISIRLDPRFDPVNLVACSHVKVPYYYAESINSNCQFKSISCSSYNNYKNGLCKCTSNDCFASMGYWSTLSNNSGKFYLETNKSEPYCKA